MENSMIAWPLRRWPRVPAASVLAASFLLAGPPAGAQVDPQGEPGGSVSVVHGATLTGAMTVSVDGVERGPAVSFASAQPAVVLPAGFHDISVKAAEGRAEATVEVGTGCVVSIVAFRPGGAGQPLALRPFAECPVAAAATGRASLRLIVTSASAGTLTALADPEQATARPGEASVRIDLPAGRSSVILRRSGTPATWRRVAVDAAAGHAYDLLVAGDGDTPVTTALFDIAAASPDPIALRTVIPTGRLTTPLGAVGPWGVAVVTVAPAVLLLLAVRRRRYAPLKIARRFRPFLLPLAVGAMLLAAAGCEPLDAGQNGSPTTSLPARGPATSTESGRVSTTVSFPDAEARPSPVAVPVRVIGPGVDAPVRPLVTAEISKLLTEFGPWEVAWLSGMAAPGERGFAVLAGHVAWGRTGAVFGRLRELRRGDRFEISAADGRVTTWEVEGRVAVRKGELPSWLTAPQATPRLALVTCAGEPANGRYPDNLIVVAHQA